MAVTPAKAGVQKALERLDSRFRGNDRKERFPTLYETTNKDLLQKRCHLLTHGKQNPRSIGYSACVLCSMAELRTVTVLSEIRDSSHP